MILVDRHIKELLDSKKIIIEPIQDLSVQLGPASFDLRLGDEFRVFKYMENSVMDLANGASSHDYTQKVIAKEKFVLHPNRFVLGTTIERVKLPSDIVARVEGRSSLGRLGIIIHATAGYIDPGFEGKITLEISNLGHMPVILYPGMRICQLSFVKTSGEPLVPYNLRKSSKYMNQTEPTQSKVFEDIEFKNPHPK